MMRMNAQLREAATAVRAKNNAQASRLLARILRDDPRNVRAWMLLSYAVKQKERKIECLRRVLRISPNHALAKERLSQLETAVETHPVQHVTRLQPFNPIPKSALSTYNIKAAQENNRIAPQTFSEIEDQIETEPLPDVVELLFEDIARLPIITSPHQELWLGIQLRAAQRWVSFSKNNLHDADDRIIGLSIGAALIENCQKLDDLCLERDIQSPKIEIWISEALFARQNIYALKQSKLRRFIRRTQKLSDETTYKRFLELTASIAEMFCWFPDKNLIQIANFIRQHGRLPPADDVALWRATTDTKTWAKQIQEQTKQTEQTLVVGYLRYVLRVARGYVGQGVDYADLVQEGFWGLMRAAKKFDYRVQARFGTYATSWIWQAIGRAIADQSRTIRVPVHVHEQLRKFKRACAVFDTGCGDCATNPVVLYRADLLDEADFKRIQRANQVEKALPKSVQERYDKAIQKARMLQFIQQPTIPFDSLRLHQATPMGGDALPDDVDVILEAIPDTKTELPESITDALIVRKIIKQEILSNLKPRPKEVIELRYGLEDGQERTLEEVGSLFGVTRERIRQIEAKTLDRLNGMVAHGLLPDLYSLLPAPASSLSSANTHFFEHIDITYAVADNEADDFVWLNVLLDNLPRSNWHQGRYTSQGGGTREEQVSSALYSLSAPAHFSDIAEQVNEEIAGKPLSEQHVYSILAQNGDSFVLLGQGVFSLVEWERMRASQNAPILPFCPMPLPDPPDYEGAFFESILVGKEQLLDGLTAVQLLHNMLQWAQADGEQQRWFRQSILSAYYLVGLIPYVFHFGGDNPVLTCTLPDLSIQELRYYCLQAMTERLTAMPEFWWLLQKEQPARPSALGDEFADIHPDGLDDVLHRLRMLAGLGAVQKMKYGRYRLTPIGAKCANMWGKQPELDIETTVNVEDDLMAFAIWE